MFHDMVILSQQLAHLLNLCFEILVEHFGERELGLNLFSFEREESVFVYFQRVKQTKFGLRETLVEFLEIRLNHDEIERTFEFVLVENILKSSNLRSKVFMEIPNEGRKISLEHGSEIFLMNIRIVSLGVIRSVSAYFRIEIVPKQSVYFIHQLLLSH
jgi:hypothetical protein